MKGVTDGTQHGAFQTVFHKAKRRRSITWQSTSLVKRKGSADSVRHGKAQTVYGMRSPGLVTTKEDGNFMAQADAVSHDGMTASGPIKKPSRSNKYVVHAPRGSSG